MLVESTSPLGTYFIRSANAVADLVMDEPGRYIITRINVPAPSRGQGLGSALLDAIIADADLEPGVTLLLHPSPSGGLRFGPLISWYKRRGFRWIDHHFMERTPNARQLPRLRADQPEPRSPGHHADAGRSLR